MREIRPAGPQDFPGVYRVCLLTGDSGRDGSGLYRNPDLLGHLYAGPYVAGAPEHAFVAVDGEGVAGYCLAVPDTRAFEAWCEAAWWPVLRAQYPLPVPSDPDGDLVRVIHAPPIADAAVLSGHPAHLHIDLLDRARGTGLGRRLVERQLAGLRAAGAPGVHLEVARDNENGIAFYEHLGFVPLETRPDALVMGLRLVP